MISRLTASAALFAVLVTAGLAFAADAQHRPPNAPVVVATATADVVMLPRVEVIGRRAAR